MTSALDDRQHFAAAGLRHLHDGWHLLHARRKASADHLAGLSGECALKAILLHFLGAAMQRNRPATITASGKAQVYNHLPGIWGEIALHAQGRSGGHFAALVASANPYTEWDVADRYQDGSTVRLVATVRHLRAADTLNRMYQSAVLAGNLP